MEKRLDPIPAEILRRHAVLSLDLDATVDEKGEPLPLWERERRAFLLELAVNPFHVASALRLSAILAPPETRVTMLARAKSTDWGRQAFEARPRVRVRMAELRKHPVGSLGRAIVDWVEPRGLNPDDMPELPVADDHDYLRAHIWETHDIWHTVTGYDCDPEGELSLQGLVHAQLRSPFADSIMEAAMVHAQVRDHLDQVDPRAPESATARFERAIAEGRRVGEAARTLFGFPWGEHWATPLPDVRLALGLPDRR